MDVIQPYRLDDEQRAQRLKELTNTQSPTALEGELAVLRLLNEEALNAGHARFSMDIMRVIGQLSQATEVAKFRHGELLSRAVVLSIGQRLAQLIGDAFAGRFDGWEEVIDDVRERIPLIVLEARNPDPNDPGSEEVPE